MHALSSFDYAVIRVVPRVERGELVNVGVILFARTCRYLGAKLALQPERLTALFPGLDLPAIEAELALIPLICEGDPEGGSLSQLSLSERFHWLVAPRSTVIQLSPVHSGLCEDPATMLNHLLDSLVRLPPAQSNR